MTRIDKNRQTIDSCISKMNEHDKQVYRPIMEYAISLGYTPRPVKNAQGVSDELTFIKSSVNRTLMRLHPNKRETPFKLQPGQEGSAGFRLVFFATTRYSEPFHLGIKRVIEEFDGKYTGCYGCGRCGENLEGYTYVYPDNRSVFRCGRELIALPAMKPDNIDEIKAMIKAQDNYWTGQMPVR